MLPALRLALRSLLRSPGFTFAAVATFALGIGANATVFGVVNAVLLRAYPFREPDRLVQVFESNRRGGNDRFAVSPANVRDWRERARSFEAIAVVDNDAPFTLRSAEGNEPERLAGTLVTADFLKVLGVAPLVGRGFAEGEDRAGAPAVALISHRVWQRRFNSDRAIVGKAVELNGRQVTVVGVMPSSMRYPNAATDVWAPITWSDTQWGRRGAHFLSTVARLKPGVTTQAAQAEMVALAKQIETENPQVQRDFGANVVPFHEALTSNVRPQLLVLMGAVSFVLLIGCANVANLTLARAAARQRETAIRAAIGAARRHLVRQQLAESSVLGVMGGVVGLGLATWGARLVPAIAPSADIPRLDEASVDWRVALFTFALAMLASLAAGLIPGLQVTRANLNDVLKDGGKGSTAGGARARLRSGLFVAEVAFALLLLAGAGLTVKSLWRLLTVDTGFQAEPVLTAGIALPRTRYGTDTVQARFIETALERLRAVPGVRSAAMANMVPLGGDIRFGAYLVAGRPVPDSPRDAPMALQTSVTDGYFATMGIPVLRGRVFEPGDRIGAPRVVVVSEALVKEQFKGEDPIGHEIQPFGDEGPRFRIVGVVRDVRHWNLNEEPRPQFYLSFGQAAETGMNVVVRGGGDPAQLTAALRREIHALDAGLAVADVRTMRTVVGNAAARPRFIALLLGGFATCAVVLALVGIYGVVAHSVTQRAGEFGIRAALGAKPGDVLREVLGGSLRRAALGIAIGLAGAVAGTRVLANELYGVSPLDPVVLAGTAGILTLVALAASWLPARRATRADPASVLRAD